MLLSRDAIVRHMKRGTIVIEPFDDRKLKTTSYDVTLGEWFWREGSPEGGATLHNIYDEDSTKRVWTGPFEAETASDVTKRTGVALKNIKPTEQVILLKPGETVPLLEEILLRFAKTPGGEMSDISTNGRWR